ncbi:MAG: 4Fe-4S dicluster domain-containing protein [Oscillospiraceae bacterium]|nr:4Fe-4S dicluster domain-containing protein [Oscillospiraceae bacterium]
MRDLKPLSAEEYSLLENVGAIIAKNTAIPCTACRYCVKDCLKAIAIPDYFRIYNAYCRFPAEGWKMEPVYAAIAHTNGKASDCFQCKNCERNCPQQIPVTEWLTKVVAALE